MSTHKMSFPPEFLPDDLFTETLLTVARRVVVEKRPIHQPDLTQLADRLPEHPWYADCFHHVLEHPEMNDGLLAAFHDAVLARSAHLAQQVLQAYYPVSPPPTPSPALQRAFQQDAWRRCFHYIGNILHHSHDAARLFFIGIVAYSQVWWDPMNFVAKERVCTPKYRFDFVLHREQIVFEIDTIFAPRQAQVDRQRDRNLIHRGWLSYRFVGKDIKEHLRQCIDDVVDIIHQRHRDR